MANSTRRTHRRRKRGYFETPEGSPAPLRTRVRAVLLFSDADPLGVAWHGRYPAFFERAMAQLCGRIGMSYTDFRLAGVLAPVAQMHVDYHEPLFVDEEFEIRAAIVWNQGARIDAEYEIVKADGRPAASGYSVQAFVDAGRREVLLVSPEIWASCRRRWQAGGFGWLQEDPS